MKNQLFIIFSTLFFFCQVQGAQDCFDTRVPKPDCVGAPSNVTGFPERAKILIDEGSFSLFYHESKLYIKKLMITEGDDFTEDYFRDTMWVFYYITASPVFSTNYSLDKTYDFKEDNDYSRKSSMASYIDRIVRNMPQAKKEECRKVIELLATYYATIIRQFRESYDSGLLGREEKMMEDFMKTPESKDYRKFMLYQYKLNINSRRASTVKATIEHREPDFVEMLVKYFPGKTNEVLKYIKLAGYEANELTDLIDRTVGRDAKTEFLYKGRVGREHDKKKKDSAKRK